MEFRKLKNTSYAEVIADGIIIENVQDGIDIMGNAYYQGFDKVILYKEHITEEFFDLKTGLAGEILQKFSNYKIRLAIIGDFSTYQSESLKAFIIESNKGKLVNFLASLEQAVMDRR